MHRALGRADPARRSAARDRDRQRHARRSARPWPSAMARRPSASGRSATRVAVFAAKDATPTSRPCSSATFASRGISNAEPCANIETHADRLADHLPWAALVAPGVVLNKDGSFQRSLRFRGPDLESATEAELVGGGRAGQQCAEALRLGLGPVLRRRAARKRSAIRRAAFPIPPPGWSTRSGGRASRAAATISRAAII